MELVLTGRHDYGGCRTTDGRMRLNARGLSEEGTTAARLHSCTTLY